MAAGFSLHADVYCALLARVFAIDITTCPQCSGDLKVIRFFRSGRFSLSESSSSASLKARPSISPKSPHLNTLPFPLAACGWSCSRHAGFGAIF